MLCTCGTVKVLTPEGSDTTWGRSTPSLNHFTRVSLLMLVTCSRRHTVIIVFQCDALSLVNKHHYLALHNHFTIWSHCPWQKLLEMRTLEIKTEKYLIHSFDSIHCSPSKASFIWILAISSSPIFILTSSPDSPDFLFQLRLLASDLASVSWNSDKQKNKD